MGRVNITAPTPTDDGLRAYMADADRYPLLSVEQERRAASGQRACACCASGQQTLVNHNVRLVVAIALRYWRHGLVDGLSLLDLVQEGNMGLMRAVSKFDASRGFRISTYATRWIQQHIARALQRAPLIALPVYVQDARQQARRAGQPYPDLPHVSASLDAQVDAEHAASLGTLGDTVADPTPEPDVRAESEDEQTRLVALVRAHLTKREAAVLLLRLNLTGTLGRCWTLEEVGRRLGISRERVRQIEAVALVKLRDVTYRTNDGQLLERPAPAPPRRPPRRRQPTPVAASSQYVAWIQLAFVLVHRDNRLYLVLPKRLARRRVA